MTSLSQTQVAWLSRVGRTRASSPESDAGVSRAARPAPAIFHLRRRSAPELRAGVMLAIGWIALCSFFVVAIARPAAQLHAHGTPTVEPRP